MKLLFIMSLIISQSLMAKTILLSGFDGFNDKKINNSTTVALKLKEYFKDSKDIHIKYCQLRTVYHKSAQTLKDCFHNLIEKPDYIISFGEGYCKEVEFEIKASNEMDSPLIDNDGIQYLDTMIDPSGPRKVRMSLNLKTLYRSLSRSSRKFVDISRNPGRFVCNQLAYTMAYDFKEAPFAFIHVPSHDCGNFKYKQKRTMSVLIESLKKLP